LIFHIVGVSEQNACRSVPEDVMLLNETDVSRMSVVSWPCSVRTKNFCSFSSGS